MTEITAPPGYSLDPTFNVETLTLTPGQAGSATFADHLFVAASFHKNATGNVNAAQVTYAGAVIDIYQGTPTGPQVASCTTAATGDCTSTAVLISGSTYCWAEVAAPQGLAGGTSGCFIADNAQAAQPVSVSDAGLFVPISAKKVDAANPGVTLPGAVLDLYRVDKGAGPTPPTAPAGTPTEIGQTWVAQNTTGADGLASFGLEYPGYAYCVVEVTAPANYVVSTQQSCSPVVSGEATVPAPIVSITVSDTEATVVLTAQKFNSLVAQYRDRRGGL